MSPEISFGKVRFDLSNSPQTAASARPDNAPFQLLILADFSGRVNRGVPPKPRLDEVGPWLVDRDNFEQIMEQLDVQLQLPGGTSGAATQVLEFRELDDFRPERIFDRLDLFSKLRATRRRLLNPATFAEAAAELTGVRDEPLRDRESVDRPETETNTDASGPAGDNLLAAALDATEQRAQTDPSTPAWIDRLIHDVVAPHVIPAADPQQPELVAGVDQAIATQMRAILHHPDFQALEAAWRGLYLLVRRLETGTRLRLFLLDVSKNELVTDLEADEDLAQTETYKALVESSIGIPGAAPWSAVLGDYFFSATARDVAALGRMAKVVAAIGTPFLTGAHSTIVGCDSLRQTPDPDDWQSPAGSVEAAGWTAVRQLSEARFLGLAMPRFLLRLPYGAKTDPVDGFTFEEQATDPQHPAAPRYLWGNAAWLGAYLLADAYSDQGWQLDPGQAGEIGGLPLHIISEDGQPRMQPCAEAWLGERAAHEIAAHGISPLVAVRNADAVRFAGWRSLADPPSPLAGPWSR